MKERGKSFREGGFAPLSISLPLPFIREGGNGDRLLLFITLLI